MVVLAKASPGQLVKETTEQIIIPTALTLSGDDDVAKARLVTTLIGSIIITKGAVKLTRIAIPLKGSKIAIPEVPVVEEGSIQISQIKVQINGRHVLNSDNIANGGKTQAATMAPQEILLKDVEAFNNGNFTKLKNGDVKINNRTYGMKNEGKTLFPRSGGAKEFIDLTQGQIKAIQLVKKVPAEKLETAVKGAGVSNTDLNFAKEFVKNY